MQDSLDYTVGIRLKTPLAQAIKNKAHDEYRSFNATLNMLLMQALKKPTIENLVEEVQGLTHQIGVLTSAIESLAQQIGGKKK